MKKKLSLLLSLICILSLLFSGTVLADEYDELAVTVDGNPMYISSDYPSELIPEGYTETRVDYQGQTFFGGKDDATQTIQLFYLRSDMDESLNGLYRLNDDGSTFTRFDGSADPGAGEAAGEIVSINGMTFQTMPVPEESPVPGGYVEAQVAIENSMLTAYQKDNASGDAVGVYLIYGALNGGVSGWYSYDQRDNTIQRYLGAEDAQTISDQTARITNLESDLKAANEKYNRNVGRSKNLFILMAVLALLFFFLMINAMVKRRHIRLDLEDRIMDLKRHGGKETQNFSKREQKRNRKYDEKAERHYDDDDPFPEAAEERPVKAKKAAKKAKKEMPAAAADELDQTRELAEQKRRREATQDAGMSELEQGLTEVSDEMLREEEQTIARLKAAAAEEAAAHVPQKGVTEDMTSVLMKDDDDFDFDIVDLD